MPIVTCAGAPAGAAAARPGGLAIMASRTAPRTSQRDSDRSLICLSLRVYGISRAPSGPPPGPAVPGEAAGPPRAPDCSRSDRGAPGLASGYEGGAGNLRLAVHPLRRAEGGVDLLERKLPRDQPVEGEALPIPHEEIDAAFRASEWVHGETKITRAALVP